VLLASGQLVPLCLLAGTPHITGSRQPVLVISAQQLVQFLNSLCVQFMGSLIWPLAVSLGLVLETKTAVEWRPMKHLSE